MSDSAYFRLFNVLLVIMLVNKVSLINRNLKVNDECWGPHNLTGICTRTLNCKFYYDKADVEVRRKFFGERNHFCRFDGFTINDQVVCCPLKSSLACEESKKKKRPESPNFADLKILGGKKAKLAEFPHFAALRRNAEGILEFVCGGVLISNKFVLTAAHCVLSSVNLTSVRLGRTSLVESDDDPFEIVDVEIKNIIPHPMYNVSQKYNDIALLELQNPVSFDYNIWPACLMDPLETWPNVNDRNLTIAGFGNTKSKWEGGNKSEWLLKAQVQENPFEECQTLYDRNYRNQQLSRGILSSQTCASDSKNIANTCQGDSGSGLMYQLDEQFYVYGITSFGRSCKSGAPSIYTRISSYLKWIEDIVWPIK